MASRAPGPGGKSFLPEWVRSRRGAGFLTWVLRTLRNRLVEVSGDKVTLNFSDVKKQLYSEDMVYVKSKSKVNLKFKINIIYLLNYSIYLVFLY